ncbi:cytochrome oxidase small assembly protein [Niveibacterium sp. 24ML]|nr:cytochrome oxidase small assembly protein [Niveibacterium sp. 24ML]MCX9155530.1 cytochrome oxidase small assembly protein [Niveibacterium sp. 24ML]
MKSNPTRANRRSALLLLSVVLVFFFGVMLKYWLMNQV